LGIALSTVNKHVEHILEKLQARNRSHAAAFMPPPFGRLDRVALGERPGTLSDGQPVRREDFSRDFHQTLERR
jgi:hypothetical protein